MRSHPGLQSGGPEAGYVRPAPHDRDVREDARTYAARAAGVASPQPSYPLPGQGADPPSLATFGLSEHDTGYDVHDDYDDTDYGTVQRPTPAQAYAQSKRRSISSQQPSGQLSVRQASDPELGSPFRPRSSSNPVPVEQARAVSAPMQKDVSRPPVSAPAPRQRRPSNSSLASSSGLTKDELIERLADAIRLEQARSLHFHSELREAEAENDRLTRLNSAQLATHRTSQQQLMSRIMLLEHDLAKARDELAREQVIDDSRVDHYLGLIANDATPAPSARSRETSGPTIGSFDVGALRASGGVQPDAGESVFTDTDLELLEASKTGTLGDRARRRKEERERRTAAALSTIDSSAANPLSMSAFDGSSETDSPKPTGTGPRKLARKDSGRKGFGFLRRNSTSRNEPPSQNASSTSLAVPTQVRLTGDEGGTYGRSARCVGATGRADGAARTFRARPSPVPSTAASSLASARTRSLRSS